MSKVNTEKITLIFSIINTIILTVGGVLTYFLVERAKIEESRKNIDLANSQIVLNQAEIGNILSEQLLTDIKSEILPIANAIDVAKKNGEIILNLSQANLNEAQSKLSELELEIKKANQKINELSKKSSISIDVSQIINDIQPNISVNCIKLNASGFVLECTFINNGAHSVSIYKPTLKIYSSPSNRKISESLYSVAGLNSNYVPSGSKASDRYRIVDRGGLSGDYYINVRWEVKLSKNTLLALSPILEGVIHKSSIESLSKASNTFKFWNYESNN